jgi:hypothetical protein
MNVLHVLFETVTFHIIKLQNFNLFRILLKTLSNVFFYSFDLSFNSVLYFLWSMSKQMYAKQELLIFII